MIMTKSAYLMLAPLMLLAASGACTTTPSPPSAPAVQTAAARPAPPAATAFVSERIVVTTVGSGPDVVLIPGLSSSPSVWADLVAAVPGYRYHLVQVKGFAGVAPQANATGPVIAPVAGEIARYIREQQLVASALIGHSMGGTWAMMVASQEPALAARVMVVDMLPFVGAMFGGPTATPERVAPIAARLRDQMAGAAPSQRRAFTEMAINGMVNDVSRRPAVLAESLASDPDVAARAYFDLLTTDLTTDLARITGPLDVLYVTPAGAPISDAQMDAFYAAAFAGAPNRSVRRVEGSAHFIMLDQPALFAEAVRAFLVR
jgi:pimeloyl-ACP methyl ester carboxylesterase